MPEDIQSLKEEKVKEVEEEEEEEEEEEIRKEEKKTKKPERKASKKNSMNTSMNMNNGMKNAYYDGEKISVKENFDISSAPTMVTVDADVSVKTWFLSAFVPDFGKNENDKESDTPSSFTDRKKIISVRSVLSY